MKRIFFENDGYWIYGEMGHTKITKEESDSLVASGEGTLYDEHDDIFRLFLYRYRRESGYPSIEDQMDMQYHDAVDGTTTWQDTVKAVKDAYPTP